jgi:hypothetical protein
MIDITSMATINSKRVERKITLVYSCLRRSGRRRRARNVWKTK